MAIETLLMILISAILIEFEYTIEFLNELFILICLNPIISLST